MVASAYVKVLWPHCCGMINGAINNGTPLFCLLHTLLKCSRFPSTSSYNSSVFIFPISPMVCICINDCQISSMGFGLNDDLVFTPFDLLPYISTVMTPLLQTQECKVTKSQNITWMFNIINSIKQKSCRRHNIGKRVMLFI